MIHCASPEDCRAIVFHQLDTSYRRQSYHVSEETIMLQKREVKCAAVVGAGAVQEIMMVYEEIVTISFLFLCNLYTGDVLVIW